jgi:hypothetical protein
MATFARRSGAAARASLRSLLALGTNAARLRPTVDYFSSVAPAAVPAFLSPRASIVTTAAGRWEAERRWSAAGVDAGGWRSMSSSSALASRGSFTRDESGKLVRDSAAGGDGGGRGGGGMRAGRSRGGGGRSSGGGGGRGGGGSSRGGDSRGGGSGGEQTTHWRDRSDNRQEGETLKNIRQRIVSKLTVASCAQDILSVVRDHLHELNHDHVSTAVNKLGKVAKSWDVSSPDSHSPEAATLEELLRLVRHFALERFNARKVANTMSGVVKIIEAGRGTTAAGAAEDAMVGALAALATAAARVAPDMVGPCTAVESSCVQLLNPAVYSC